jgi:serine/threonine protein phosphatase Stp1
MMRLRHSAATHVGLVRQLNEDSILILPEDRIWVVSDGMGGHSGGDYASQTVVDCIAMLPALADAADRMRALRGAIQQAHGLIRAESAARGGVTIGATVVALMVADGHFVAFWAGDSRLYRLRDGQIELLTFDHSIVGTLVAEGRMSWDEADLHPEANAITCAVGVGEDLDLDKVHGAVEPGDRFLLCSDGLSKYAGFETLRQVLASTPLETVADRLVSLALTAGGADNVSVIVVDTA